VQEQHQAEQRARQDQLRLQRARELREALLSDPSLAFAYWFLDDPDAINDETGQRIETLVAAVASYAPSNAWVQAARILLEFVTDLSSDARQHLINGLAHIFERYGQHENARQLRDVEVSATLPPLTIPHSGLNGAS
jgi:hypothetical protein